MPTELELYPFQVQAINKSLETLKEPTKDLIKIPTGGGKTRCISETAKEILKIYPDFRFLIIAHRTYLLDQAIEEFEDTIKGFKNKYGRFDADNRDFQQQFIFASKDSLHNKNLTEYFSPFDFDIVFIDECHHCHDNAISYMRVLDYFAKAKIYGYTATPIANNGSISAIFGEKPLVSVSIADMIKQDYLCLPACIRVKTNCDLTEVRKSASVDGFNQKDLQKVIDVEKRNKLVLESYEKYLKGKSCVIFALNKQHVLNITKEFKDAGYKVAYILQNTPAQERIDIKNKLKSRELDVVINCTILTEGFNVKALESIIITRPVGSLPLLIQMIGRVLRKAEGKDIAKILMIWDKPGKHTLYSLNHIVDGVPDIEVTSTRTTNKTTDQQKENPWLKIVKDVKIEGIEVENLFKKGRFDWLKINDSFCLYLDAQKRVEITPFGGEYKATYIDTIGHGNLDWIFATAESYIANNVNMDLSKITAAKEEDKPSKPQKKKIMQMFKLQEKEIRFLTKGQAGVLMNLLFNKNHPNLKNLKFHERKQMALDQFHKFRNEKLHTNKIK
jgi:superfamily II DNA or RNA helicase